MEQIIHTQERVRRQSVQIDCAVGDIVEQSDVEAIVNAANAELRPGGGVVGAIHRAAGPRLAAECQRLAPIRPGEAVSTGGHNLPSRHVIHCLGPVYGGNESATEQLESCYRQALRIADEQGVESIAFPAISTGAFGYPFIEASEIACRSILEIIPSLSKVDRIRLVFSSQLSANIACTILNRQVRFESKFTASSPS